MGETQKPLNHLGFSKGRELVYNGRLHMCPVLSKSLCFHYFILPLQEFCAMVVLHFSLKIRKIEAQNVQ